MPFKKFLVTGIALVIAAQAEASCIGGEKELRIGVYFSDARFPQDKLASSIHDAINANGTGTVCASLTETGQGRSRAEQLKSLLSGESGSREYDARVFYTFALFDVAPEVSVFTLPFALKNEDVFYRLVTSPAFERVRDRTRMRGLHLAAFWPYKWRQVFSKAKLSEPSDVNGLRFGALSSEAEIDLFAQLGAKPVRMAYSELSAAARLGVIDGASLPFADGGRLTPDLKNVLVTNHSLHVLVFAINEEAWQQMDLAAQDVISTAVHSVEESYRENRVAQSASSVSALKSSGVNIVDADAAAWKKVASPVHQQFRDKIGGEFLDFVLSLE